MNADLRITLQHCLQTKTRQIAHYNVNGLGQGFSIAEYKKRCWILDASILFLTSIKYLVSRIILIKYSNNRGF
jgi:hypothetical protein